MRERFPSVEADDTIQETLIALVKTFPVYHYSPEEKGSFHNCLTGILRNKALRQLSLDNIPGRTCVSFLVRLLKLLLCLSCHGD